MADHLLLIEDDPHLGAQVVAQLEEAGYAVTWLTDAKLPLPVAIRDFQLLILDLMLPSLYGLDLLKRLRDDSDVPVLILSARSDSVDKVRALQLGADDYVTKPFWPGELIARVQARLRRPVLQRGELVELGGLRLDLGTREAAADGQPLELTPVEFDLLAALARRPGAAVARSWLMAHVLEQGRGGNERALDVHVSRLRKKLGEAARISAVWGVGYRLEAGSAR